MATVRVVIRKNIKADGTYPLVIRITKDKKTSYIGLDYSIYEKDWDAKAQRVRKSHPSATRMNNFIIKKLSEATNTALETETDKSHVSSAAIRQKIKPNAGSTFLAQAKLYLDRLEKDGKFNQHSANKPRLKHFKDYIGHDIAFQDISVGLLERFKADLKTTYGMAERSAVNHLVFIRSVFSQAIKEKACDKKYYPFGKEGFKIKFPDTNKIGLNQDEVKRIETIELKDPLDDHARDVWLLSYYFAGMRISDVLRLKWSDFQDGRLVYIMGKNNKSDSLKIPEKAAAILRKQKPYKSAENDLVFRDLDRVTDWKSKYEVQRHIASRNNLIGQHLKLIKEAAEIKKPLSMHISRHTFGNISSDKISIKTLQKLYRHSSPVTTAGYQSNFVHHEADEALDAVLGI